MLMNIILFFRICIVDFSKKKHKESKAVSFNYVFVCMWEVYLRRYEHKVRFVFLRETVDCESDMFYCQSSLHKKILQDDDEVSAANGSVGGHSTSLLSSGTNLHLS